ncbi:PadR family transcriptional regulator [Alicyclobacillus acidiphilus]|uniref:PadR family transcriptional regulator n=1 Tax=Alicyclobacillus acidiphilus TaxID=182455 RepID=UPI000835DABB|nr:PadR family transcriptional regulator [Alicyclobacillus acidiphilus]
MYADILILGELLSGPKHGYEIKKDVQRALGEGFELNNNLLYPALRRFLETGAISKQVIKAEGKPDRNVYILTDEGERRFYELIRDFPAKSAANSIDFLVRVAFFDRLDPDVAQGILQTRQDVLWKQLEFCRDIETVHSELAWAMEVVRFQITQIESELAWIDELKRKLQSGEAPAR